MTTLQTINGSVILTSLALLDLINQFRQEIEGKATLQHRTLLDIIRDEFEEEIGVQKILQTSYTHPQNGQTYPMFELTPSQAKQVLLRESKQVRKAVIKYIEELEAKLTLSKTETVQQFGKTEQPKQALPKTEIKKFHNKEITIIHKDNQIWLKSVDIENALNFSWSKTARVYTAQPQLFGDKVVVVRQGDIAEARHFQNSRVRLFTLEACLILISLIKMPHTKHFKAFILELMKEYNITPTALPTTKQKALPARQLTFLPSSTKPSEKLIALRNEYHTELDRIRILTIKIRQCLDEAMKEPWTQAKGKLHTTNQLILCDYLTETLYSQNTKIQQLGEELQTTFHKAVNTGLGLAVMQDM